MVLSSKYTTHVMLLLACKWQQASKIQPAHRSVWQHGAAMAHNAVQWCVQSWLMKRDEMQHSDDGCSMVQHGEVQQVDEMQHCDGWRSHLGESVEATNLQLSWATSCIIFLKMIYALIWMSQSVDFCCKYTIYLSLSLQNYWRTYKKNWSRVSPHWGLSLASTTSCVLLSWLVFCELCLCSICNLL